jgi:hypothetical protein
MPDQPTMEERKTAFAKYLLERLFGLVAVVERPAPDENFPQASGVVMDIQGCFVLVTVGHFLKDVLRWKEEGRLRQLSLLVHHEAGISASIELDLNKVPFLPNDSVDVGFMVLPKEVVEKIDKFGGKLTRKEQIRLPSGEISRYYLIGQAAAHCKIRTEAIATDADSKWQLNRVAGLPVAIANLRFMGIGGSPETLRFVPEQGVVTSYAGFSGGPIFGYADGRQIREYAFIGIQSEQILEATREQKPRELIATSAMFAVVSIDSYLEEVWASVDSDKRLKKKRKRRRKKGKLESVVGKVVVATTDDHRTKNWFCIIVGESPKTVLLSPLETKQLKKHLKHSRGLPVAGMEKPIIIDADEFGGREVFRAKRALSKRHPLFLAKGRTYEMWDGQAKYWNSD